MSKRFDVFLSHNSEDKPQVLALAQELQSRGVKVWLDMWELVPGTPWQSALENAISESASAAVLVGESGLGPWHKVEMRAALTSFIERNVPVIPVMLPGAPARIALPIFLAEFSWVDLREGITDQGLERLIWGITGKKPELASEQSNPRNDYPAEALHLETVFCTAGLPTYTYVEPKIYKQVASDLRQHGKHILLAGASGSGKTCLVFRILNELGLKQGIHYEYIPALQKNADKLVKAELERSFEGSTRIVIIDDFHLLKRATRLEVSKGLKYLADMAFSRSIVAKFILVGISSAPEGLLVNTPDLGPRLGVYRMPLASSVDLVNLVRRGEERLLIEFSNPQRIVNESCGSYFICQFLCKEICLEYGINKTADDISILDYQIETVRCNVMGQLSMRFKPMLVAFAMSNGGNAAQIIPVMAIVAAICGIPKSLITLDEIISALGNIGNLVRAIESTLPNLILKCVPDGRFSKYLYYEEDSEIFSIEDPVFRYYLNHLPLSDLIESVGIDARGGVQLKRIHKDSTAKYSPPTVPSANANGSRHEIFISYSHADRKWLDTIQTHLKALVKADFSLWSDARIAVGSDWELEIQKAMDRATIAILLVSSSYLASDFIMLKEVPRLLERAKDAGLHIVWIPLQDCAFEQTPIGRYQAIIPPRRPLASMSPGGRDKALTGIVRTIANLLEK